jgi:transcriptional regulator with XRE-family HTH domain
VSTFGTFVLDRRHKLEMGLRRFCMEVQMDPGSWSKVERGLESPPQSREKLTLISDKLNLSEEEKEHLFTLARLGAGKLPDNVKHNPELLAVLPAFFRTIDRLKPSQQELRQYVADLMNNESKQSM